MSRPSSLIKSRRSVGASETGRVRDNNQDAIHSDDAAGLWLVADGMGGHAGGARASEIAKGTITGAHGNGTSLRESVLAAHNAIRDEQGSRPEFGDMGTTIVVLSEHQHSYEICWVGDSRAYRFSPKTGVLELLTRDHNVAGMLVAAGALSPEEAARHPQRHVLTDCLGLTGEHEPRVGSLQDHWKKGEWLLLCSDGLSGELNDREMEQILRRSASLESAGNTLIERTLEAGAHDNVSIILVECPSGVEEPAQDGMRWPWPFRRRSL